jgi:hypothetical protein
VQNGTGIHDDLNGRPIPGLERFSHRLHLRVACPMTFLEQVALSDVSVELDTACHAAALMLQALGLGGWMETGINPFGVLRASGDPAAPGLGFRFGIQQGNPRPRVTGLPGVCKAHVPPHHADMRAAVLSALRRKFGTGGRTRPLSGSTTSPTPPFPATAAARSRPSAALPRLTRPGRVCALPRRSRRLRW